MSYLDGNYVLGSEYLVDILFWVKQHERRPSLRYKKISPQLAKRGQLIEWARDVNSKLGFCDITFHLAVRLIDLFMDGHDIAVSISIRFETIGHLSCFISSCRIHSCIWWPWEGSCWQLKWRRKMEIFRNAPDSTALSRTIFLSAIITRLSL